jgi:diguanylate cyclase (GGDEF)-like protein
MCDIDHFKRINDSHGHPAGDAVLREFAAMLNAKIRVDIDWVARFGGEEFVVVLPETDLEGALQVGERLRAATAALEVRHEGQTIRLTASYGIATASAPWPEGSVAEQLLTQADLCLYLSKKQGRDRVTGEKLTHLCPDSKRVQTL